MTIFVLFNLHIVYNVCFFLLTSFVLVVVCFATILPLTALCKKI